MIAFEETERPIWHAVKSPREVRGRVTLCNSHPVYLLVIAKRTALRPIFKMAPQQSDYTVIWDGAATAHGAAEEGTVSAARSPAIRIAKQILPMRVRRLIRSALTRPPRRCYGFDPAFFTAMPEPPIRRQA